MDRDIYEYEINKAIKELDSILNSIRNIALNDMEEAKKLINMGYKSDNNSKILSLEESIQDSLIDISNKIQSDLEILKK